MSTEVIIPWAGNCVYRGLARSWVQSRWTDAGFNVVIAEMSADEPWSKGQALYPAVAKSPADVVVITDGDVWTDGAFDAVGAVESTYDWAVPFGSVHRLDERSTSEVLAGGPVGGRLARKHYPAVDGGGIVVLRRDAYLEVPIDPRFRGWGYEDESWGAALRTMLGKEARWRSKHKLWHLWHPPQVKDRHSEHGQVGTRLRNRYLQAARRGGKDRPVMESLLAEARAELGVGSPT